MFDTGLTQAQSLRQEQNLSVRQLQSLELLHAPIQELQEQLAQALTANPVLEAEPDGSEISVGDPLDGGGDFDSGDGDDDLTALAHEAEQWHDDLPLPSGDGEDGRDYFFNSLTSERSLADQLLDELRMTDTDASTRRIAELVIGSLDESGYLRTHPADLAMALNVSLEAVERAVRLVQSFEPAGIAASSLAECLRLQLERSGEDEPRLLELIDRHLDDIGMNRLPQVARAMKLTLPELDALLARLRRLDPCPGAALSPARSGFVAPEVVLERDGHGGYTVRPGDRLPRLHIPERYFHMLEDPALSDDDRAYIREKIQAARELIRALALRESTIRRIAGVIAETQRDFFDRGVDGLRPMTMRQVADQLELHETTVSRAIAGKYLETPRGVLPFRYFFSGGFVGADGAAVSSRSVRERIRQLVDGEDAAHPLSDERISGLLADDGLTVARRTVAKYREELGIPATSLRRRHC